MSGLKRLAASIPEGERVLIDSSTLAAYFDAREAIHPIARHVVDEFVATGRNPAHISAVTAMEILVRPLRSSVPAGFNTVVDFLRHFPGFTLTAVDLDVALAAAQLRASYQFAPPDALIIGTGLVAQVGRLVTNDHAWTTKLANFSGGMQVVELKTFRPFP